MIIATALKVGDLIITMPKPARHGHLFRILDEQGMARPDAEQGFIDVQGRFLTRRVAGGLALLSNQLRSEAFARYIRETEAGAPPELFTEDLW